MEDKVDNINWQRDIQRKFLVTSSVLVSIIGLILLITYTLKVFNYYPESNQSSVDFEGRGFIGDYIGGVIGTLFSLVGILLLFLTLKNQRESFEKERFENRFFEMVKIHRENVREMTINDYEAIENIETYDDLLPSSTPEYKKIDEQGVRVFIVIYKQIQDAINETAFLFQDIKLEEIYNASELRKLESNNVFFDRNIDLIKLAKYDILYLIVFFGLGQEGIVITRRILASRYIEQIVDRIINYMKLKPVKKSDFWKYWLSNNYDYQNGTYTKYYGGHQIRLGHYYRHLFATFKYLNENNNTSFAEKYNYAKYLRAQITTYEQAVFFYNSLSLLGRAWEFDCQNEIHGEVNVSSIANHQLITKYNLIKNVPAEFIALQLNMEPFYPDVEYELSSITNNKSILKKLYY